MEDLKKLQKEIEKIKIEITNVEANKVNLQYTLKDMLEKENELKELCFQSERERKENLGRELVDWGSFIEGYANVELNLFTFDIPLLNHQKEELINILTKYNCKGVIFHLKSYTDLLGYFQMVQQVYEIEKNEIVLIFEY